MLRTATSRRAGPLFGAGLALIGALAAISPVIPIAQALGPTPEPTVTSGPVASTAVEPTPTADPAASVTPSATSVPPSIDPSPAVDASATPTADPSPSPSVDASAAPSAEASAAPSADASASPLPSASATPSLSPTPEPTPGVGLNVRHYWISDTDAADAVVATEPMDTPLAGMQRFHVYLVRFQVLNSGDADKLVRPTLDYSSAGGTAVWARVPEVDLEPGVPFYAAADNGKVAKVRAEPISVQTLELATSDDHAARAAPGVLSAGINPAPRMLLRAHTFTEIEFAVRATVDADWESSWLFRLGLGAPVETQVDASVTLGSSPPVILSPGQQSGTVVDPPAPAYPLTFRSGPAIVATLAAARVTNPAAVVLTAGTYATPHQDYTLSDDRCATCHRAHTAEGGTLTATTSNPMSTLCFACHNGTGANANVQSQYTNVSLPANNSSTSSYYLHPATTVSNHTLGGDDEFRGVLNRHSQCTDCHQPHNSSAALTTSTAAGWKVGGAIMGASGVSVANGAANAAPTYTWQRSNTYEYQLCFKCHSGYTTLPSRDASHPSWWALDKAIELNPANASYHPIEAAGRNASTQMAASLSGTAPGKLWTFATTSVIRCENCHGASTLASPTVSSQIDNHASVNRGILLRNYRDRVLKSTTAAYAAADFALCYLCHAEAPFVDQSGNQRSDSYYRYHGVHTAGIAGMGGGGTSIDTAGAGQGNAICAECHFRIHGSSFPVGTQTIPGSHLVNFAPDVQPYNGVIRFVQRTATTAGSCTLTCHGVQHTGWQY